MQINVSIPSAPSSWTTKMFHRFRDELQKSAAGIDMRVHDSATLFKQGEELKKLHEGTLDMATCSIQDITELLPEYSSLTQGYLFKDFTHLASFYKSTKGQVTLKKISDKLQIQILAVIYIGTRVIGLKDTKPVIRPEDLKDVALRMPEKESWLQLGKALGAKPVPVSINDVVKAYEKGDIDGQDNPLPALVSGKTEKFIKQIVLTNHMVDCLFVCISKKTWKGLNSKQKKNMQTAAQLAKMYNDTGRLQEEIQLKKAFADSGKIITQPDLKAFQTHMQAFYAKA